MSAKRLRKAYEMILTANTSKVSWLNVGDSQTTDGSTNSNLGYGMQRVFRPPLWGFRTGRAVMGATAWSSGGNSISSEATVTARNPGDTFGGGLGLTAIAPVPVTEWEFTANRADGSAVSFGNAFLNDSANYAVGNVWASNQCYVRQSTHDSSQGIASFRLRAARNTGTDASPVYTTVGTAAVTNTGVTGWKYAEGDCGAGAGSPAVQIIENSINEFATGAKWLILGTRTFIRGTIGQPIIGFGLGDIATGGHTAQDVARVFGDSTYGAVRCTAANAAWLWANMHMNPNIVHLNISQNQAAATQTALNAGDGSLYKAEIQTCINAINNVASLAGGPRPLFILANSFNTAYSETNRATRSLVIEQLADETNNAFIDYSLRMPTSAGTGWWTADDIHPTADGASLWAATLWNAMVSEYQGFNSGTSKPILRGLR